MSRIRLLLVDDHAVVRRGLSELLSGEPDLEVMAVAEDGTRAVELARELRPDVILMDLQMPGTDGVEATRTIVSEDLGSQVLVLTSFSDAERILDALDAGAVGYLLKDAAPDEVIDGVRAVARGESPLHPKAARELLRQRRRASERPQLTPRELEILELVRQGFANKQIARRLGISDRTVKAHLTAAFQRIGVADRTAAALWLERNL